MKYINKLPDKVELAKENSINENEVQLRAKCLKELKDILAGKSSKKVIIIGPCSADREDAVLEYVVRLKKLQERVHDKFLIIPRIYTSKPRTSGKGYKGLVHRPYATSKEDDIIAGIKLMRELHVKVIQESELFAADELLYPELYRYVEDLLVYMAIGARSVEDQQHRLVASGVDIPVGMKNPTSGSIDIMLNSIVAAQSKQYLPFAGWEVETEGNTYAHAILRGFTNSVGVNKANYYYENLCELHDKYYHMNLLNPSVVIDCNHANSNKRYEEQVRIAQSVFDSCRRNKEINKFVKGIMVESYLVDGNQMIGEGIYGCSITDPCLGWEKTKNMVLELAENEM